VLDDRLSYAEVLLELVQSGRPRLAGLDMARASTVHARVERILTAAAMPARVGWRKRIGIVAALVPVVVVSSGTIAYRSAPAAIDAGAAEQSAATVPWLQDIDFYAVNPRSVLAIFRQGDQLSAQITGQRKLRLSLAADRTYSYPATGGLITFTLDGELPSELTLHQNGRDLRAVRIAARHRTDAEVNAMVADQYIGWYQLTPGRVLVVTREGERMQLRETGRAKFEVKADGADAFSSAQDDLVVFIRDGQGTVTQALVEDPASGARLAPRIDADRARGIEEEFARRIAEIPDRFRDQAPAPGSKEAVLRGIADMQRGAPNYERMSAGLAAKIRQQAPQLQAMLQSLGAVSSIFFRGVGPGGYDIYGMKFANGSADLRMLLGADGKIEDVLFHPSGNGEPGRFAACSDEPHLKLTGNGAPITIILYNNSGDDIQLYSLDASGSRTARGTLSDSTTLTYFTTVDGPWVVSDRAGQCLEIMLPGLQTRYHMVERGGGAAEYARRITPLPGSEEMLRQYIDGVARGQPIYDRMTAQLAAQTRQQLPFDRAILGRLGALRALTFRGVTALGADIYVGHFANGSAEWRIGLARDGSIGRIALGPQY
jgi:bla regulator protein blaR1